ncbi:MAG: hypothetical protein KUG76_08155 [Gammaproteobacteria bacterium]|nr:hypothetical protein [Gammaproteobacteria bacterium]
MDEISQDLIELNKEIVSTYSDISKLKSRPWYILFNCKIKAIESQLWSFRKKLSELDSSIEPHTKIPTNTNDITAKSGKLSILFATRNMAFSSLGEAQKLLSNLESKISFKFTTLLSVTAIVISIVANIF